MSTRIPIPPDEALSARDVVRLVDRMPYDERQKVAIVLGEMARVDAYIDPDGAAAALLMRAYRSYVEWSYGPLSVDQIPGLSSSAISRTESLTAPACLTHAEVREPISAGQIGLGSTQPVRDIPTPESARLSACVPVG